VKTRISTMARQTRYLRKGAGAAIVMAGAGLLVQSALPLATTTVISAATALAVAMLLAFVAAMVVSAVRPEPRPQPVRIALPAPHPWR
jgi:hypothetical protein